MGGSRSPTAGPRDVAGWSMVASQEVPGQYLTAGATPIYCDCDFPTTRGAPSTALSARYCAAKIAPGSPRRHERTARHHLLRRLPDFGTRRPNSPKLLSPPSPTLRGRFLGDAGQFRRIGPCAWAIFDHNACERNRSGFVDGESFSAFDASMIAGFKHYYRTLTLNKLNRPPHRLARWPQCHALKLDIIIGRFTYRSGFFHLSNPAPRLLGRSRGRGLLERWHGRGLLGRSRGRGLLERWRGRGLLGRSRGGGLLERWRGRGLLVLAV